MIQELLGGGKISNPFSSTPPLLTTTTNNNNTTSIATTPPCTTTIMNSSNNSGGVNNNSNNNSNNNNSSSNAENNNTGQNNLRCPRCDSTNTKFCYYNNYNLTQPRHFCKTCRRYWTKGGTLRNVPIGGGCRKNKSTISTNSPSSNFTKSNNFMAKVAKATLSSEMLVNDNNNNNNNSLFLGAGLLDHPIQSPSPSPLPWSSLPQAQNSHILALLRGSNPFSNPNPNSNSNPNPNPSSSVFTSLGLEPYSNGAPSLLGSFTRSNPNHLNGFGPDYVDNNGPNSNILDLYQRLKSSSSTNYGYNDNHGSVILGHMVGQTQTQTPSSSSSSMNSTIFDASTTPYGGGGDHMMGGSGGGYGFMSTSHGISSWNNNNNNEFPAVPINGAYP